MAETQVTHDGISKEEKEKNIEEFLKKHKLYIVDAPKVHHREANIIEDDVRYPLIEDEDLQKNNSSKNNSSTSKTIFDYDDLEEIETKNNSNNQKYVKIYQTNYQYVCPDLFLQSILRSGLVTRAVERKSYTVELIRPNEGAVTVNISEGDIVSILTYDGGSFSIHRGKVIDMKQNIYSEVLTVQFILDTSKVFSSETKVIDINTIVDIRELDYQYDLTIYGVDIQKIYTDWVQDDIVKKPNTIAPTDNIKYTRSLPPIRGDIDNIKSGLATVKFNTNYTITLLNGAQIKYNEQDIAIVTVLNIGDNLVYGYENSGIFYEIPQEYSTRYSTVKIPIFTHLLKEDVDYTIEKDKNPELDDSSIIDISIKLKSFPAYVSLWDIEFKDNALCTTTVSTTMYCCYGEYYIELIHHFADSENDEKLFAHISKQLALRLISKPEDLDL